MILPDCGRAEGKDERDAGFRVTFFATLPLLSFAILAPLGSIDVIGIHLFVLLFLLLGQLLPIQTVLGWESLPLLTDCFGQIGLALLLRWSIERCCLLEGCLTVLTAFSAEKDECILWALDIIVIALLRSTLDIAAYGRLSSFVRRSWRCGEHG